MEPTPVKPLTFLYVLIGLVMVLVGGYEALTQGAYVVRWPGYTLQGPLPRALIGAAVAFVGVLVIRAGLKSPRE